MHTQHRCPWVGDDPLYVKYHDEEWGLPLHDDQQWFEFLSLEAFQAGLSWYTILLKRENFQRAFDHFDPERVANYGETKVAELLADAGIVRNRLKVRATIHNAQVFLKLQQTHGSFDQYIWQFVEGKPIQNHWKQMKDVPANTPLSDKLSKTLKKEGFKFMGSTVVYAFMQATGLVNDHLMHCFRQKEVAAYSESDY